MRPTFSETDLNERPFLVFWEVTRACALACKHCRAVAQPRPHPEELNHEEALRLIDRLAELRPPMLVLTGGDPIMRPDILELIRAAADKGLHVALSPAATARLVHADFHALKEAGVQSMSLSLDGAHGATHDAFRGVPNTYERTLRAAEMAKEAGMHLQINTTITRSTLGEFDDFVELMKKMQPGMWSVFLLVPTGRAAMDEMPAAEQVEAVWKKLSEVSREVSFGVKTTEGHHYRRVALQEARAQGATPARRAIPTEKASCSSPTPVTSSPPASSPSRRAMSARTMWAKCTARTLSFSSSGTTTRCWANAAAANTAPFAAAPAPGHTPCTET